MIRSAAVMSCMLTPTIVAADARRTKALLVSAARAGASLQWGLVSSDHINSQRAVMGGRFDPNGGYAPAGGDPALLASDRFAAEATALFAIYNDNSAARVFVTRAMLLGRVMPVVNGHILVKSHGHHYVDPHKPIADRVIGQVYGGNLVAPAPLVIDEAELKDALAHKACHTLASPLMTAIASDDRTPTFCDGLDVNSASVGLPARSDAQMALHSVKALFAATLPVLASANIAIGDLPARAEAAEVVHTTAINGANANDLRLADRTLVETLTNMGGELALLRGFFHESCETPSTNSLLKGKFLKRMSESNAALVERGRSAYARMAKFERGEAASGNLVGTALGGAPVPETMVSSEAKERAVDRARARAAAP
jgi:hypothetical protein